METSPIKISDILLARCQTRRFRSDPDLTLLLPRPPLSHWPLCRRNADLPRSQRAGVQSHPPPPPPLHPRPWEGASGLAFMALALPFSRDDPSPASGHPSSKTCCCSGLFLFCRPSLLPCPLLAAHLQGVVAGSPEGVRPRWQDPKSLPHSTRQTLPGHIQYLILHFCVKKTSWNSEKL